MNSHPLKVSDPKIRKILQIAGLRFCYARARWLASEAETLAKALQADTITTERVDAKLAEMNIMDLVYPELMMPAADEVAA